MSDTVQCSVTSLEAPKTPCNANVEHRGQNERKTARVPVTPSYSLLIHSRTWSTLSPHLSCLQHFIAQQKIRRNAGAGSNGISQYSERIVHSLEDGVHWLARLQVQANDITLCLFILKTGNCTDIINWSLDMVGITYVRPGYHVQH